ncbi:MAG: nucleotidyltransferase [Polyangiaceae bacterium]|nr:nucleotidyltransferase [Polyangiaceae bacterium]
MVAACSVCANTVYEPKSHETYRRALVTLNESGVDYLVGGAFALEQLAGIPHKTHDLDIFTREKDSSELLAVLQDIGATTEMTFPHWLAKAHFEDCFVDVIYSSGNGVAVVDDEWFDNALTGTVLGVETKLCPPEETLFSKAYIMERERYDGADIAHLLRSWATRMDWDRLVRRFGPHWRVLLSHLVLFGFVYPGEMSKIPPKVIRRLARRLVQEEEATPLEPVCRGGFLSRGQYLIDFHAWGYVDARRCSPGRMSDEDIAHWTNAMQRQRGGRH